MSNFSSSQCKKSGAAKASLVARVTAIARREAASERRPRPGAALGSIKRGKGKSGIDELKCMLSGAGAPCPRCWPCTLGGRCTASLIFILHPPQPPLAEPCVSVWWAQGRWDKKGLTQPPAQRSGPESEPCLEHSGSQPRPCSCARHSCAERGRWHPQGCLCQRSAELEREPHLQSKLLACQL